jgi:RNA polymerase sigma-70 factor (ECF subfamily)
MKHDKKNICLKSTGNDPHEVLEFVLQSYNMMGFATKLTRDPEAAKDLMQDTAERILRYAPKLQHRGDGCTKSWATSIMYGIFVNKHRQKKAMRKRDERMLLENSSENICFIENETEEIPESEISSILLDALNSLTDRQKLVTFLFARDYQYKEIADMLGIPMGTVMSTLGRGRKAIRENEQVVQYVRAEYGIKL